METKQCMRVWIVVMAAVAMCVLVATPAYAASVYDGAVGYWNFDNDSGNTVYDATSNHTDGTNNGGTWTANGRVGGAYGFDGYGEYISIPSSQGLNFGPNDFSMSVWVKPNEGVGVSGYRAILDRLGPAVSSGAEFAWGLWAENNHVWFRTFHDGASAGDYETSATLSENNWQSIITTRSGSSFTIYLNGDPVYSGSMTETINSQSYGMYIGNHKNWPGLPVDGLMDEVAVWNQALTTNEIDALYKTGFISDAMSALSLSYTTDQINQLANIYLNKAGTVTIGDSVWSYVAHNDPIWLGHETVGATFNVGGVNYLYLGGGISQGPLGGGVPEPSSMAVSGLALGLLGLIKRMRRKED